ncbi:ribosome recycling factor [Candidatus Azambacteria bacterium RIFCSPLOWO2_02_FULL_42_10]|nr:MAG: ribosome recycling factor [Candidatus Azambacteria bacterium RIFCSPLOWO2_02_FULL_42_10]
MDSETLKNKLKSVEDSFKKELSFLRVGRATPALVENISVDYYGTTTPLKQIASISAPEPRSLVIDPWDKNAIPNIEKAIFASGLGLSPIVDKNTIRINVPSLTEERRKALIKIAGSKLEDAKIKCRTIRDEAMKELTDLLSAKKITEDEKFKKKEKTQELINETNRNLESSLNSKEREIREE